MTAAASLAPNGALPAVGYRKKIAADFGRGKKRAAGIMFMDPQANVLMLRRSMSEPNYGGYFAWPGGGVEDDEDPLDGAVREAYEEIGGGGLAEGEGGEGGGDAAIQASPKELDRVETPTGGVFHTFVQPVSKQFAPRLNSEHSGYVWTSLDMLPRPLHPAVEETLRSQVGVADDMDSATLKGACDGFMKWARGEDEALEQIATDSALRIALDKDSVRSTDKDGRLRVAVANITKANVCPYKGSEIPLSEMLGLEPDRIYYLLRDPEELRKAAPTLNGVPLLRKHVPVNADDHQPDEVVGSLGTDAAWSDPYLTNSLFVNARAAIDGIMSGAKRELSAGYHYTADMTPGIFGVIRYDGVMRDIVFNHVALVEDGRAGPDIVVGDSTENLQMAKPTRIGALALQLTAAHAAPLLALDASMVLPRALFAELTSKNFAAKKAALLASVKLALDGKMRKGLAFDESGLAKLIDALEDTATKGVDDSAPDDVEKAMMETAAGGSSALAIPPAPEPEKKKAGFDAEAVKTFLREKGLGEDAIAAVSGMFPSPATDEFPPAAKKDGEETEEEKAKKKVEAEKKAAEDEAKNNMKDMVTKTAMDEALKTQGVTLTASITKQVRDAERGVRLALDTVEPWVGKLPVSVTMAFDSAGDVYRHTAGMLRIPNHKTLHVDALLPIIQAQARPGQQKHEPVLALDEAAASSFATRFPDAARIQRV